MKVNAIFDLGKTNKKLFLFDSAYQQVFKRYSSFEEVEDEDGFPCDDLPAIQHWIRDSFHSIREQGQYDIRTLNFSTYGASFVHLDKNGDPLTPLYNYLKPIPKEILSGFYDTYGGKFKLAKETASPPLGMLNSGLQLYWLKYAKPNIFSKIRWSLHFPQYLSYLFTGIPISEYTSIGCHTFLWDFSKNDYHDWVYQEELDKILPPIVSSNTSINIQHTGKKLRVGVGIHDSSAALLPYVRTTSKPFLLISTGTWSISINPFNQEVLSEKDLQEDCLNFMRVDGKAAKAARLFLGNEYKQQVKRLLRYFGKEPEYHRNLAFDRDIYAELREKKGPYFQFESIRIARDEPAKTSLSTFSTFEEAYHQLMIELVELQVQSTKRAIGNTKISGLYIDGGFADNEIFIQLLANHFPEAKLKTSKSPLGSALGAAMVVSKKGVNKDFLKKNYSLEKHKALSR